MKTKELLLQAPNRKDNQQQALALLRERGVSALAVIQAVSDMEGNAHHEATSLLRSAITDWKEWGDRDRVEQDKAVELAQEMLDRGLFDLHPHFPRIEGRRSSLRRTPQE